MTLHYAALVWVAEEVKGHINHELGGGERLGTATPDIIVSQRVGSSRDYHEVEALNFSSGRLKSYISAGRSRGKVLWIALPEGTLRAFSSIRIIERTTIGFRHALRTYRIKEASET